MRYDFGTEPAFCRPEAFRLFLSQIRELNSTAGLLRAAVAVSSHSLEGDDRAAFQVEVEIQRLAQRVIDRCPSGKPAARLAHLHEVLFEEERFVGNLENYYVALNSYLPVVLHTKRGLPIILALLYKAVGERVGLQIEGINSPAHFLARVWTDEGWLIIDPFFCGQALSTEEAYRRMELVAGHELPRDPNFLATATHEQWLSRILGNLQSLFATQRRLHDLKAMTELQEALTRGR